MTGLVRLALFVAALGWAGAAGAAPAANPNNVIYLDTAYGRVVIAMRPDLAPATCDRIRTLIRRGFYNGVPFHRVIAGFMAQTGDPTGTGRGGSGQRLKAEFSDTPFVRGTVGMARAADLDSADSQFFITYAPAPQLDGKYTVWGEVVSGMQYVDRLKKGDPARDGMVVDPDRVIRMQIAADAEKPH